MCVAMSRTLVLDGRGGEEGRDRRKGGGHLSRSSRGSKRQNKGRRRKMMLGRPLWRLGMEKKRERRGGKGSVST